MLSDIVPYLFSLMTSPARCAKRSKENRVGTQPMTTDSPCAFLSKPFPVLPSNRWVPPFPNLSFATRWHIQKPGTVRAGPYQPSAFKSWRRWYLGRLQTLAHCYFIVFNRWVSCTRSRTNTPPNLSRDLSCHATQT